MLLQTKQPQQFLYNQLNPRSFFFSSLEDNLPYVFIRREMLLTVPDNVTVTAPSAFVC